LKWVVLCGSAAVGKKVTRGICTAKLTQTVRPKHNASLFALLCGSVSTQTCREFVDKFDFETLALFWSGG